MNYAFAAKEAVKVLETDFSTWSAILQASFVVQFVLLILVGLSIFCWSVFFYKKKQLRIVRASNKSFLEVFWRLDSLDKISDSLPAHPHSSMARIFNEGYQELQKIVVFNASNSEEGLLSGADNLERALSKSMDSEINFLEQRISILATTGSTGPFIGLFGTVWGIMGSFQKIGVTGVASLAVVAPGISEALIATAMGLAAAIPATVSYNHFVTEIKRQEVELNNFCSDFLNIAKRNFFKTK